MQGLAQILFGFTNVFVVERGEIEPQQGQAPDAGDGFGGQAFTAALHPQQHHPFGGVALEAAVEKGAFALLQPVLQPLEAAHAGELFSLVLETEHAFHVHQLELGAIDFRQVAFVNGAIVANGAANQAAAVVKAEALKVGHQLRQCLLIGAHSMAFTFAGPESGLLTNNRFKLGLCWQAQAKVGGQARQFRRHFQVVADQRQRRAIAVVAQSDVF